MGKESSGLFLTNARLLTKYPLLKKQSIKRLDQANGKYKLFQGTMIPESWES